MSSDEELEGDERRKELLARWQWQGDREALDELLREEVALLAARIKASGARQGRTFATTAQDLAQGAVLRLLRCDPPPRFGVPAELRQYLWVTARHALVDGLRSKRRQYSSLDDENSRSILADPATTGGIGSADRGDLRASLELSLNLLSDADHALIEAAYLRGQSRDEMAAELGIDEAALRMRLVRARGRLAEKLSNWVELLDA